LEALSAIEGTVGSLPLSIASMAVSLAHNSSGHAVGPGQPSVTIGEPAGGVVVGPGPHGFSTAGFANAETHYAGPQPQNSNNVHCVSQYDFAAFQLTAGVHSHN